MAFSVFFFSSDGKADGPDKYRMLFDIVEAADNSDICAVWVPERHFVEFGGLYPNPSVIGAALAVRTKTIGIRAGSVVLPLHHPARVAEEWAVVDNLSNGRVGLAFASGWHNKDFQIAPGGTDAHARRHETLFGALAKFRQLWRGEPVAFEDPSALLATFPRPIQPEVPVWIASQGNEMTFRTAGRQRAGILTGLVGQTQDDLARKIAIYREEARIASDGAFGGHVVAMVHTYLTTDDATAKERAQAPLQHYLTSFLSQSEGSGGRYETLSESEQAAILENTFERYFEKKMLMGSSAKCQAMVEDLIDMGIDEVACLVDFGLPPAQVLDGIEDLKELASAYRKATDCVTF